MEFGKTQDNAKDWNLLEQNLKQNWRKSLNSVSTNGRDGEMDGWMVGGWMVENGRVLQRRKPAEQQKMCIVLKHQNK